MVDNCIPMTDIYVDIPVVRPQVDVFIMNDANLDRAKNTYVLAGRMDFSNFLHSRNILPQVNIWDMHTYQYSQAACLIHASQRQIRLVDDHIVRLIIEEEFSW